MCVKREEEGFDSQEKKRREEVDSWCVVPYNFYRKIHTVLSHSFFTVKFIPYFHIHSLTWTAEQKFWLSTFFLYFLANFHKRVLLILFIVVNNKILNLWDFPPVFFYKRKIRFLFHLCPLFLSYKNYYVIIKNLVERL